MDAFDSFRCNRWSSEAVDYHRPIPVEYGLEREPDIEAETRQNVLVIFVNQTFSSKLL